MGERRYRVGSRGRSPSPRRPPPRSRNLSPSRHRRYSPYQSRKREEYNGEAERSRRIDKSDHVERDFNFRGPRSSEYDNRGRDRHVIGARRSSSPRRIEKRDNIDGDFNTRNVRLSGYDDGGKGKYGTRVSVGRYGRSYDEDSYRGDLSSMKFGGDHLLDGCRKSGHVNVKDYSLTPDYYRVSDTNITAGGSEMDDYLRSRYSDTGRAGLLSQYLDSTKPVSLGYERGGRMHAHTYTLAHAGVDDRGRSNLSVGDGSNHKSSTASRYLNTDTDKQGYFHFRDEIHLEKRDGAFGDRLDHYEKRSGEFQLQDGLLGIEKTARREMYNFKKEGNVSSQGYLNGDADYLVSSSQPKDYVSVSSGTLMEDFSGYCPRKDIDMPSHTIQKGSGLASDPVGFDGYSDMKHNMPLILDDIRSSSRLYLGLPEEKQGDRLYAEFGRGKLYSTRLNDVEEVCTDQHLPRIDDLNPTVDESSHRKHIRDNELWAQYPSSGVQLTPDKFDAHRSLLVRNQDLDMLSSRLNYGTEGHYQHGSVIRDDHHAEVDGGQWCNGEGSDILESRRYGPEVSRLYDSPRKRLPLADWTLGEPCERRLRHKQVRDEISYEHGFGIRISTDGNGARKIYHQVNEGDESNLINLSKMPKSGTYYNEKMWKSSSEVANDQPSSSKFISSHSVDALKSDSRDIKMRLGPVPCKLHVSQRLTKKHRPSIKKRLAPAPPKKRASLPWLKNLSSNRMAIIQGDSDESPHDQDADHMGDDLPLAKAEPPENSQDFKQLVQSAFFKVLKQINETPMKRRNYMEQGKVGSLKCIVCGSNSEEFVGTESLAMHAFTCENVGLRSQHLGLHKALCVLMGWKFTDESSSGWHCDVMSSAEKSALNEDLIIWPPVVIIHNSTVDSKNPDERVIVSTEELDMKLRDMGFGSILKVCNGKPANQSVILVKFNGTLSGLQEAESFHQNYIKSEHGRAELKQLKSKHGSSSGRTGAISSDTEEFLYGHLGIAEDLDKLDFDSKKRCVLRSKKEILNIANAPFFRH
ncbi:uncharacterized protein LOC105169989 [Sesamum indicum]|uniref:Uncharacterized protein LOC105169989 n=1 Tax=Sesamum indicum TaxID=4182 RepID=A0A6I9U4U8_SESIN|nr:uncharacterized protein LOC105169989 [Sesamum indicum]